MADFKTPNTARRAAAQALFAVREKGAWSAPAVSRYAAGLSQRDTALVSALVGGVLQNRAMCDFYLQRFSKVRLKKVAPRVLDVLRLAVYQLVWMERIPDSAAVNESVELVRSLCRADNRTVGYANGLLRAIARNRDNLPTPDCATKEEYYALRYSHPRWLVKRYLECFGVRGTRELLEANNRPAPTVLRVNTQKSNAETVLRELEALGVEAIPHPTIPNCLTVTGTGALEQLPPFAEGRVTVQDGASQMSVYALAPQPGEWILDCCAAPGGKSFFLAERMRGTGRVIACDIYEHKLTRIAEGAKRLGLENIETQLQDAAVFRPEWEGKADRVLCDVPCSGLGIIRKKPEIRYKDEEELRELPAIQAKILRNCSHYVKDGGTLVYSTCTLLPEENEQIVEQFLKTHPRFELVPFELPVLPEPCEGTVTLLPHIHETDGFFVAKFKKKAYYDSNGTDAPAGSPNNEDTP